MTESHMFAKYASLLDKLYTDVKMLLILILAKYGVKVGLDSIGSRYGPLVSYLDM
jgi:hypothetical protein